MFHWGGNWGGFGRLILMLGAFKFDGSGPVGGTKTGWLSIFSVGGWVGTWPGRLMDTAFPGFFTYVSVFLKVCEGGASAVSETMFYPLTITRPRVRLICLRRPVFLALVILYSSVSARTTFICLSKARNVPTIILPSWMVILTLKSIHWRNLLRWVAMFDDMWIANFYNRLDLWILDLIKYDIFKLIG